MSNDLTELIEALHRRMDAVERTGDQRHMDNVQRFARLEASHEHIDESLDDTKVKLFGNGQPGVIATLMEAIEELQKDRWRAMGAVSSVFSLATLLILLFTLLKGH